MKSYVVAGCPRFVQKEEGTTYWHLLKYEGHDLARIAIVHTLEQAANVVTAAVGAGWHNIAIFEPATPPAGHAEPVERKPT